MTVRYGRKIIGCRRDVNEDGDAYVLVEERESTLILNGKDMTFGTILTVEQARELARAIGDLALRVARRAKRKNDTPGPPK